MYTIEDFRHAPMRPLATAETPEQAYAAAAALGITEHAFIRPIKGSVADAAEALDRQPSLLFELSDAEDRADNAEREMHEAERENDRLRGRIGTLRDEKDALAARVVELSSQPSLPTEAA